MIYYSPGPYFQGQEEASGSQAAPADTVRKCRTVRAFVRTLSASDGGECVGNSFLDLLILHKKAQQSFTYGEDSRTGRILGL